LERVGTSGLNEGSWVIGMVGKGGKGNWCVGLYRRGIAVKGEIAVFAVFTNRL
jgi:hypothetical protein